MKSKSLFSLQNEKGVVTLKINWNDEEVKNINDKANGSPLMFDVFPKLRPFDEFLDDRFS